MSPPKFQRGQLVKKTRGARFWGRIANEPYYISGSWHYDIAAEHPDFLGTIHIMVETQIELLTGEYELRPTQGIYYHDS